MPKCLWIILSFPEYFKFVLSIQLYTGCCFRVRVLNALHPNDIVFVRKNPIKIINKNPLIHYLKKINDYNCRRLWHSVYYQMFYFPVLLLIYSIKHTNTINMYFYFDHDYSTRYVAFHCRGLSRIWASSNISLSSIKKKKKNYRGILTCVQKFYSYRICFNW